MRGAYKAKRERQIHYTSKELLSAAGKLENMHYEILKMRLENRYTWEQIALIMGTTPYLATRAFERAIAAVKLLDWKGQIAHERTEEKNDCFTLTP